MANGTIVLLDGTSSSGINVLADHVLVDRDWVEECARLFDGLPAYLVGVRCPLEVVEQRERSRKNRTLGQAQLQFDVVHRFVQDDPEVDTSGFSPEECARQEVTRMGEPPYAWSALRTGMI